MKKSITMGGIVLVLAALLAGTACIGVHIRQGVRNADRYFDDARREIVRLEREDPGRRGDVHQVCVLVHDRRSEELVEINTPLWMANSCLDMVSDRADRDWDRGLGDRYDLDLKDLKDLRKFGPGLLVDINDRDSRVLIWLR